MPEVVSVPFVPDVVVAPVVPGDVEFGVELVEVDVSPVCAASPLVELVGDDDVEDDSEPAGGGGGWFGLKHAAVRKTLTTSEPEHVQYDDQCDIRRL